MQDHGIVEGDSEKRRNMENSSQSSSGETKIDIADCIREKNNTMIVTKDEAPLSKEQDLPKILSSSYENIPLNSTDDREETFTHDDADIIRETDGSLEGEKVGNVTEVPDVVNQRVMGEEESVNVENCENAGITTKEKDSAKNFMETPDEPSIEDSCEAPSASSSKENDKERSTMSEVAKQRTTCSERRPTITDDSRLVKISLPTSSMNIMQTNAQFLNKSRNFFNFITEKSTNIMEKTLLPQNLAGRYNSILKMNDASGSLIEKKNIQGASIAEESSTNISCDTRLDESLECPTVEESLKNKTEINNAEEDNFMELKSPESSLEEGRNSINESHTQEFVPAARDESVPLTNDCLLSSDKTANIVKLDQANSTNADKEVAGLEKSPDEISVESSESLNGSTNGLLRHPVYLTLVRDYAKTKEEKLRLAEKVESLEAKNRILEAQNNPELFNVQLEALEKTVERLTTELHAANQNQEELGREYAAANKERESMVMKYAVSEKQLIDTQRARDFAERRYKEIAKDYELLQNKLRQAQSERTRICSILDTKCRELTDSQKEVERLKEDVNVRDVKLKWSQTKLKTEMETHKETQVKLDKATTRINDMREECEQIRRESQETIRQFQHSEENKAVTLDQQLKEQQARLILERHVTEDKEILRLQLQKEVDQLKNRQLALIEENNTLSLKIQDLEKNRLSYESRLSDLKNVADQRQKEIVDLSAKVSHFETLKLQLIHKEQCLVSNEAEVERLRQVNQELQADMDCCRQREAHMLDFTQKLTDKNVRLQSEFTAVEAKAAQLEQEQNPLRESIAEYKTKLKTLEESLAFERKKRTEECEILAKHLAEQTQIVKNLTQRLEESEGEIAVLRRKQQISVKEMSRELQHYRKRLETYESASPSNSLDPTSRAGSNNSLNAGETPNGASSDNSGNGEPTRQSAELDRQSLIDRILKMQKINVRRAEKLDFLEEHTRTLVAELQKKTKIIQNYILHENFDAMGSNERDRHKAELARYGGIMASVYNHRVSDDNMTLELSLEINQKLQAVLEDALLKNITLKDNIDTLGEEIARLTIINQQLLQQKGK